MAYARRVDANQSEVVEALRLCGWYVCVTSAFGDGFFDLVIQKPRRTVFVELKDGKKPPSARKLTQAEADLHADFIAAGAEVVILESIDQAVAL